MAIFRVSTHLGSREVLMGTDDYNDKSITLAKLGDDVTSYLTDSKNACDAALELANGYNNHPPIIGNNGNWYIYDSSTSGYIDSGNNSRGDILYPSFVHENNKLYMVDNSDNAGERIRKEGNKLVFEF